MRKELGIGILIVLLVIIAITLSNQTTIPIQGECIKDSDCAPAQCCHPTSCVPKDKAPDCSEVFCTMECRQGTMDCGQGYCACIDNKCQAVIE